ncbi:MAG TPA: hypothetical protein DCP90_09470 [Clostridiales bacterium]|nr:hypothetical protein [Clostridiales bacterium]
MYPTYKDGDVIRVEKQESYNDGDTVVADVGGKKVIKRINGDVLEGDNKQATARYNLKSADILGKAEYNTDKLTNEEKAEFDKVFASGVAMISAGSSTTMILKSDGTVYAWGGAYLGNDTALSSKTPVQVVGVGGGGYLTGISQISVGSSYAIALKSDGTVYAWGFNGNGQLGDNTIILKMVPVQVKGVGGSGYLTGISQISASSQTVVALKSDGTVYTWGYNAQGQLGIGVDSGTILYKSTPVQVKGVGGSGYLTGVSQVSAGSDHIMALKSDGTVYAWGRDDYGQLGDGTNVVYRTTPVQAKGVGGIGYLTGVSQISVGWYHSVALKSDGTVYGWGASYLGNNTTVGSTTPVQAFGVGGSGYLTGISQISAGGMHTIALKSDGTVYSWGWNNDYGQIGDNTTIARTVPVQVLGVGGSGFLTGVSQISGGDFYTVALKSDGTVYIWGANNSGQIGDNTTTNSYIPVQTLGVGGVGNFNLEDTISPGVTITANTTDTTNASSITYTFNFAEGVSGFEITDVSVINGTTGTFSGSGSVYELDVTNSGSCTQTVTVNAGVCIDGSGNSNTVGTKIITVDTTPPANPTFEVNPSTKTTGNVTVTINYPGDATTKKYQITDTGTWLDYTIPLTIPDNCTIYTKCADASNNENTSASLSIENIDRDPPDAPTVNPATGTYNLAQTVIVTNTSIDVVETYYTTDGSDPDKIGGTSTEVTGGTILVDGNDGQVITLKLVSYDGINKGAIATYEYTFNKTGPIITPSITGRAKDPSNINVTITITSDNLESWAYQWDTDTTPDAGNWTTGTIPTPQAIDPQAADGTWYLHVRAEDEDENIVTQTYGSYKKGTVTPSEGYAGDTYADERKHFKYYIGLDANNIGRVMLVAPKDAGGVKTIFTKNDILDSVTHRFKVGGVYFIDREGKIREYD